jgi:hypothetical protein
MSEPEDDTGTGRAAIAVREQAGGAIITPVPIPRELQEAGVRIAEDPGGLRVIVLPPEVRQRVNLLTPVSSWNQADPNWTPSISLVKLDKDAHTYFLPGGKLGLNKQALETLGRCAGVLYTRTTRVPLAELHAGEKWAYRATVGFRRSDGSIDEVTRERGFNEEAEQMEIEDAVRSAEGYENGQKTGRPKFATDEAVKAECRKRWIAELRHGPAKTESKAINRALRAGLAMPSSVKAADLNKPFLVIGFNFTPDYSDPTVKRALVAVGLNAQAAIYGGRDVSDEMPEHGAADIPALPSGAPIADEPTLDEHPPPESEGGDEPAQLAGGEPTASAGEAAGEPEPAFDDEESESAEDISFEGPEHDEPKGSRTAGGMRIPEAAIEAAGAVVATNAGKTIAEVVALAGEGNQRSLEWLAWAKQNLGPDEEKRQALELYAAARAPEMWANIT